MPMIALLEAISASSRKARCNSAIAASITTVNAGTSAETASRLVNSATPTPFRRDPRRESRVSRQYTQMPDRHRNAGNSRDDSEHSSRVRMLARPAPLPMRRRLRPTSWPRLQLRVCAPVCSRRREDVDDDGARFATDDGVRAAGGDAPDSAPPQRSHLVSDSKDNRPLDHDPELLVVVLVLGQSGPGLHLNNCQRQPLAVNGASEIASREQLRRDRMQILERAHPPSPTLRRTRQR